MSCASAIDRHGRVSAKGIGQDAITTGLGIPLPTPTEESADPAIAHDICQGATSVSGMHQRDRNGLMFVKSMNYQLHLRIVKYDCINIQLWVPVYLIRFRATCVGTSRDVKGAQTALAMVRSSG